MLELVVQPRCPAMKSVFSSVEAESVMVVQVVVLESQCHLAHSAMPRITNKINICFNICWDEKAWFLARKQPHPTKTLHDFINISTSALESAVRPGCDASVVSPGYWSRELSSSERTPREDGLEDSHLRQLQDHRAIGTRPSGGVVRLDQNIAGQFLEHTDRCIEKY